MELNRNALETACRRTVCVMILLVSTLGTQCSFPPKYVYFEHDDRNDTRIPDWEIEISVYDRTPDVRVDSLISYSVSFLARPRERPPSEWLGVDSLILYQPDSLGVRAEDFYVKSFENWAPKRDFEIHRGELRVPPPGPDSLRGIVVFRLFKPKTQISRQLKLEYGLVSKEGGGWFDHFIGP